MKLQLNQNEIEKALAMYIGGSINMVGKRLTVDFTAGRKAGGLLADLNIEDASDTGVGVCDRVENDDEHQTISGQDTEVPSLSDLGITASPAVVLAAVSTTLAEAAPASTDSAATTSAPTTDSLFGG